MKTNQQNSAASVNRITCKPDFSLLEKSYKKNQLIVRFNNTPSDTEEEAVMGYFKQMGYSKIKVFRYSNCPLPVQLWEADGIDTVVSGKGVKAGTGPGTQTVGENYSLNFLSKIPNLSWNQPGQKSSIEAPADKKEVVKVAVLDTGIDPFIVEPGYVGTNMENKPGYECFSDSPNGWNFINDSSDIEDDNPGRHGSLVTQFIINEFKKSPDKTVQIIPLKTHDSNGHGDLFKIFCAVYYAIAKGAKIINASWGFYYYEDEPLSQLNELIDILRQEGILFVTAAGNQSDADDTIAKAILAQRGINPTPSQLRNLAIHQFMPANLSEEAQNLITVTTSDGDIVSATENYSNVYVDMGVIADKAEDGSLVFEVPFKQIGPAEHIGGSSFATAIATGIIGANCDTGLYIPKKVNKQSFIDDLFVASENAGAAGLCQKFPALEDDLIKDGICVLKQPNA
ncbi:MAG: S8 family serine peptidase [Mucilaginibacter sp.]|uniref:S8 family serine peptidase n=1 Tax=Mucilaginibacter sp. TaxID=1882438 RepID=UPI0031A03BF3